MEAAILKNAENNELKKKTNKKNSHFISQTHAFTIHIWYMWSLFAMQIIILFWLFYKIYSFH